MKNIHYESNSDTHSLRWIYRGTDLELGHAGPNESLGFQGLAEV